MKIRLKDKHDCVRDVVGFDPKEILSEGLCFRYDGNGKFGVQEEVTIP